MNLIDLSIVVPVFNSGRTLKELCRRMVSTLDAMAKHGEIIFVDDGSADDSWHVLQDLRCLYPETVKIIRLAGNFGQSKATVCGLRHSNGKVVVTIDDDLQYAPETIPVLLEMSERTDADVIYGLPREKKHALLRRAGSRLVSSLGRKTGFGVQTGSSFRLLSRPLCQKIGGHNQPFIYIDEIIRWHTGKVEAVFVEHDFRPHGKSGYSIGKLMSLMLDLAFFYSTIPVKLMLYTGLTAVITSLCGGIYLVSAKPLFHAPISGTSTIILTALFLTGIVVLCLSIIGSYLSRILRGLEGRPLYVIEDKIP